MAKKPKPRKPPKPPEPPVVSLVDWAPLEEVRIRAVAHGRDLDGLLRSGELRAQVLWQRNGVWVFDPVDPDAWERISSGMLGPALGPAFARARYFVERKKSDELLPPLLSSSAAGTRAKPGTKPMHDWPKHAGRELATRAIRGESVPTVKVMLQWCVDKWGWQPDETPMRNLINKYRELFDD
jgi:hypothetical protein